MRRLPSAALGPFCQPSGVLLLATVLIMVAGSIVTHLVAVGEAGPGIGAEAGEAAANGAILVPPVVGPLGALLLLGLVWLLRRRSLGAAWFVLLPPVAFAIQELTERLVHAGSLSLVGGEPSPLAALLVQVPFAILAFVLARLLRAAIRRIVGFVKLPASAPALRAPGAGPVHAGDRPPQLLEPRWCARRPGSATPPLIVHRPGLRPWSAS